MRFLFIILLFPFFAQAQTRLYFPVSEASPVNPSYDVGWTYAGEASRYKLANTKGSSTITVGTQIGPWTSGDFALDRQYVSTRMNAGITFTNTGQTAKGYLMAREYAAADNVSIPKAKIYIVSEDGSTIRATLFALATSSTTAEFINNATHRNRLWFNTIVLQGSYTTVLGDRIVIEIGYLDASGSSPEASIKWGENATDLPENETQTTDGAGWIEFSNTITFAGETGPTRRVTIIQ